MLRRNLKQLLQPVRQIGRLFLASPTIEEQQFVSTRGCLHTAAQFTARNAVAGDYLEFGVWRGDSFVRSYHAIVSLRRQHTAPRSARPTHRSQSGEASPAFAEWAHWSPRFFAFDSFCGLPKPTEHESDEEWVEGAYSCSEQQFRATVAREGVDLQHVVTVPEFYQESLNDATKEKYDLRRAAVVHIDCDLYESTKVVLDFITNLVVQGTVIVFDDWFFNQGRTDMGEQRACREWLEQNPHIELIEYWRGIHPISFIVNFKTGASQPAYNGA